MITAYLSDDLYDGQRDFPINNYFPVFVSRSLFLRDKNLKFVKNTH